MKKILVRLIAYSIIIVALFVVLLSLKFYFGDGGCAAIVIALLLGHVWGGWSASPTREHFKTWVSLGKKGIEKDEVSSL